MKEKVKRFMGLLLVAAMMLCACLSGCSGTAQETENPEAGTAGEEESIRQRFQKYFIERWYGCSGRSNQCYYPITRICFRWCA